MDRSERLKMTEKNEYKLESTQKLAERLSLPVQDYLLLSRALTHRSYLNEHREALEDNERLEFLGDAVLELLVGAWLYNHFPEMAEGELTKLRSALVRTEQLAAFAREIKLGRAIRLGRGENENGGRDRDSLLCATFEALIGSIYLDAGFGAVQEFVEPMLESHIDEIIKTRMYVDPKSILQEWAQAKSLSPPKYRTISESGPEHEKVFEVEVVINGEIYGVGIGHSKQAAAKKAAEKAIKKLGIE